MRIQGCLAAVLVFGLGCGSTQQATEEADAGDGGPFVPQVTSFNDYCHWTSSPATAMGDGSVGPHTQSPLATFWNQAPPHGSAEFTPGTIVVIESEEANASARTVFAMAKRTPSDGGYNADGGGWEWWALEDNGDCTLTRLWRGAAPPTVQDVAAFGAATGDCNGCHAQADNDFVWDSALQLSKQ
jgi:hypothetical protein